ncbi:hypothetical protein B0H13DRAFT_2315611 [Mycena leptocephala]|nr:hypothetical protein B0H13DRAFT_2315611 [Mycena leptocephala]
MASRRTPEQRAQALAQWYEKFPATLASNERPAPPREINIDHRCLTPIYVLGWELGEGECITYVRKDPNFRGRSIYDINFVLHQRWRRLLAERKKPFISLGPPQWIPTRPWCGILRVMYNNRSVMNHYFENSEEIIKEMLEFMEFDPEMKERLMWHQGPKKL